MEDNNSATVECKSRKGAATSYTSREGQKPSKGQISMTTQLHLAFSLVDARAHSAEDRALLRNVEIARREERRARRAARRTAR